MTFLHPKSKKPGNTPTAATGCRSTRSPTSSTARSTKSSATALRTSDGFGLWTTATAELGGPIANRSAPGTPTAFLPPPIEGGEEGRRYAPPRLIGQEKIKVSGNPEEERICTSHVERGNWTLRTHLRRFTRLSNGFSRKKRNLRAALALYFAYYNFVRMHKTIRMTPAMAAGIARKPWSVADLIAAAH